MEALEEQLKAMRVNLVAAEEKLAAMKAAALPPQHTPAYKELKAFLDAYTEQSAEVLQLTVEKTLVNSGLDKLQTLRPIYLSAEEYDANVDRFVRSLEKYTRAIAREVKGMRAACDAILERADANFETKKQ